MYEFSRKGETILREILHKPYLLESIRLTESFVSKDGEDNKKDNYILAFNEIFTILIEARSYVDDYLTERQKNGEIQNKEQAIKSIAGNSFSQIIIYIFLQNKKYGNIRSDIYIWTVRSSRKINEFTRVSAPNALQTSSRLIIAERLSKQGF
jgi:type II restriction enzyme